MSVSESYVIFKLEINGGYTQPNLRAHAKPHKNKQSRHGPQWGHTPLDIVSQVKPLSM